MSSDLRVRFAPSPTGFLHVGGARTALFNWLHARRHGGVVLLRIEDTDRARSTDEMTGAILDGMTWLGLDWDEGPVYQADGLERHKGDVARLLEVGAAYRCFCTPERIEAERRAAAERKEAWRYDRLCLREVTPEESARRAEAGEPFVVRMGIPEGETTWEDAVHGPMRFANKDIEDFIVLRTDGTPIYNLAVVSDDAHMRVTHVIRGDDHLSNTPKQIQIYRALGWPEPVFAHVPMILGSDGKRLSKRHGATAVAEYRELGILPWAMVNFLALLGWSPGQDEEIFDVDELVARFDLADVQKRSAVFDTRKLEWLNGQHISRASAETLDGIVTPMLIDSGLVDANALDERRAWYLGLLDMLKVRARTFDDFVKQARPYFEEDVEYEEAATRKHWKRPAEVASNLAELRTRFAGVAEWGQERLEPALRGLAEEREMGAGKLIHPLRIALTGMAVSPGIFEVLGAMGRERTLRRIDAALPELERRAAEAIEA
ncbi:MAG: glutamate--tRNA ligase [Gemmatimonadota bacterium]